MLILKLESSRTTWLAVPLLTVIVTSSCSQFEKRPEYETKGNNTTLALTAELVKQINDDTSTYTTIAWLDSTSKNLGELKAGSQKEVSFRFKNTGDKALEIFEVTAACGCTVPELEKNHFEPGETGEIKAMFNSEGFERFSGKRLYKEIYVKAGIKPNIFDTLTFSMTITK